jgi:hypothetical protein
VFPDVLAVNSHLRLTCPIAKNRAF